MENIGICIIETDKNYARALSKSISRMYPGFSITTGISKDSKNLALEGNPDEKNKEYDIYLVSSSFSKKVLNSFRKWHDKTILLYDALEDIQPDGYFSVDKYSTCDNIVYSIIHRYAESSKKPLPIKHQLEENFEIVSFFATQGGVGTTSVALGFARELAMYRGKKVLFLSREPFESATQRSAESGGSSEYLYYFLKKDEKKLSRIRDAVIVRDDFNVMRFIPSGKSNKLCELTEHEFMDLVSHLITSTRADTVVIDRSIWIGEYLPGQRLIYVLKADSSKCKSASEVDIKLFGFSEEQKNDLLLVENSPYKSIEMRTAFNEAPFPAPVENVSNRWRNAYTGNPIVKIEWDGTDFVKNEDGIEISLTNIFGNSIKELADLFLKQTMNVENLISHEESIRSQNNMSM